jgi:hypothetical protein
MSSTEPELTEWVSYLRRWIFKGVCPVCQKGLNRRHSIAHIASCNFNGPSLSNGFLQQVKNREWAGIVLPFSRPTSQDMMACELLRCHDAMAIVVWSRLIWLSPEINIWCTSNESTNTISRRFSRSLQSRGLASDWIQATVDPSTPVNGTTIAVARRVTGQSAPCSWYLSRCTGCDGSP